MLDGLRQFIAEVVSPEASRGRAFDDTDYRLAATALLVPYQSCYPTRQLPTQ